MSSGNRSGCCLCFDRSARWTTIRKPTNCCGANSTWARPATTGTPCSILNPRSSPACAGAWHYETDGHLRPDKLMRAWRANPREPRRRDSRTLRTARPCRRRPACPPPDHQPGRIIRRSGRGRDRRLDAAIAPIAAEADRHPARQGLLADDAAAGDLPPVSDDLRGTSRGRHAVRECATASARRWSSPAMTTA